MATIDTSIYQSNPLRSMQQYQNDALQGQLSRQGIQQNALALESGRSAMAEKQRQLQDQDQIRTTVSGLGPNSSPDQQINALRGLATPTAYAQAESLQKQLLDRQKTTAELGKTDAETQKAQIANHYALLEHGVQSLQGSTTPQQAQQAVMDGVRNGYWSMQDAQQKVSQIPQDPVQFAQWRDAQLKQVLSAKDMLEQRYKDQTLAESTRARNQTDATTRRGQDLTNRHNLAEEANKAAETEMGGKPPPGWRWNGPGRQEAIPGGPGDKLPEAQQKQVIGTQNLSNAIGEYRKELAGFDTASLLNTNSRALMGTKYNNMMLQAKEAYNLGVLNGPDMDILQSVITDPRSFKGAITSRAVLDKQASELDRIMKQIASVSGNRRPQDAVDGGAPQAPAGTPSVSNW